MEYILKRKVTFVCLFSMLAFLIFAASYRLFDPATSVAKTDATQSRSSSFSVITSRQDLVNSNASNPQSEKGIKNLVSARNQIHVTKTFPEDIPQRAGLNQNLATSQENTNVSRDQVLDYEFISHYNEGLDWLRPIAKYSHVYHKGLDKGPPFDVYKWEKLPNIGRESHTYLYHIITNYNQLANVTVFLQGHGPASDKPFCFPEPMDFVTNANKNWFCVESGTFRNWNRINHIGKWLQALTSGQLRRAELTLGEFYFAVFGTQHPISVTTCMLGCFAATRENLRRHPTSFYERAMSFIDDHSDPEEAHYMERLWKTIING